MRSAVIVAAGLAAVAAVPALAEPAQVQAVFAKRCLGCHGPSAQMAGLRLDDVSTLVPRGLVAPGKPEASTLLQRLTSTKKGFMMPPGGERVPEAELAVVREWIAGGAKAEGLTAAAPARSSHWSFQPLKRPAVPACRSTGWVRNPIDNFILAKLEAGGIAPSPEASKTELIRRLSLDLTGLPPTPAEAAEFTADTRADAYERLVDRLLASPHYGERWARHWLDLARYADSDGYEKDLVRPWAWRYRNWVIDAFNNDMPFDRFTLEQIAGDRLPDATTSQRIATGFHRAVLTNREAGVDRTEARFEQDVNRTNTLSTVWLGLTTGCAQCHNHKYDPISQRDYYRLFAYSGNIEEDDIDAPLPGELGTWIAQRPAYEKEREAILKEYGILDYQRKYEARVIEAYENPGKNVEWDFVVTSYRAMVDNGTRVLYTPHEKRSRRDAELMTNRFLASIGPDFNRDEALKAKLAEAREKLSKLESPVLSAAMAVRENGKPPRMYIAQGGDYRAKGPEVEPGVPAILTSKPLPDRTALAQWLVSDENPLTARVTVNRMWQEFFGRGIVRTSEDFGTQGEKPTHPELLNWLAAEFREKGWSTKHMHRLIVTSATYRQSSKTRPELKERDPANLLLARQSRLRLPAELIRDSALAAGGLLNTSIGGPSVRPPQPKGVAELGYGNSVKWKESTGADRYRRGLYIHYQRTTPYPMLTAFDAPDSNVACTRRARSNTPLQALNLLNDPVFVEAAQGMAYRLLEEAPEQRIDRAFRIALARAPSSTEKERLSTYLARQTSIFREDAKSAEELMPLAPAGADRAEAAAWAAVSRVLLNLDEFITRE